MKTDVVAVDMMCPYSRRKSPSSSKQENENAAALRHWIQTIKDPENHLFANEIANQAVSQIGKKKEKRKSIFSALVIDEIDCDRDPESGEPLDAEAFISFRSGETFRGGFSKGEFNGPGTITKPCGQEISGTFKASALEGWARIRGGEEDDILFREEYYVRGWPTAIYREVLSMPGRLLTVKMSGMEWRETPGEGICFSRGKHCSKKATSFLYPDLIHALTGVFDEEFKIIQAEQTRLASFQIIDGVLIPIFVPEKNKSGLNFEHPTSKVIAQNPLLRDEYEHSKTFVADSKTSLSAGEGLYAKTGLRSGDLIALFNGVRIRRFLRRMAVGADSEDWSDYAITLSKDLSLDIPSAAVSCSSYCATLGHKVCHSFQPNARFDKFFHPRFGLIMAVFAAEVIPEGEEVTVNYRYPIQTAPAWYRSLWNGYLRKTRRWSWDYIDHFGYEAHEVNATLEKISNLFCPLEK